MQGNICYIIYLAYLHPLLTFQMFIVLLLVLCVSDINFDAFTNLNLVFIVISRGLNSQVILLKT